jgi:hypothetical protein
MGWVRPARSSRQEGVDQTPPFAPGPGLTSLRAPLGAAGALLAGPLGLRPQVGQVVGGQLLLHLQMHVVFTSPT